MKKITCIIVEDEPASQDIMRRYVADYGQLDLTAVCNNALEANDEVRKGGIDLLFLDINMPKLSGLDFYKSLTDPPAVIFTTAYPEYAVNGFEVNAIDYLVKPFAFERFVKAINKFNDILQRKSDADDGYALLMADKKMHKVSYDEILFVEGMGDYIKVHTTTKLLVVHQTLQKLHELLPQKLFFRIHKSFIISVRRLDYIEGNMAIVNHEKLPIGQTYRETFLGLLQRKE